MQLQFVHNFLALFVPFLGAKAPLGLAHVTVTVTPQTKKVF